MILFFFGGVGMVGAERRRMCLWGEVKMVWYGRSGEEESMCFVGG